MKALDLLNTEGTEAGNYFDAILTIGIKGQKALQVKQLFAMERMYENWNDWRVRLGVWLIGKTN